MLFALVLGTISNGTKLFEVLFFTISHANTNGILFLDYFGGIHHDVSYALKIGLIILSLGALGFLWRNHQLHEWKLQLFCVYSQDEIGRKMKIVWKVLQVLLALFLIYGGIQHFLKPAFYEPFVPAFLPVKTMMVYASGLVELLLGVLLLIPKYTKLAATGIIILMFIFLPIHVWDVFSETPAIGSHQAALIRLPFQFLFIAWAYAIKRFV